MMMSSAGAFSHPSSLILSLLSPFSLSLSRVSERQEEKSREEEVLLRMNDGNNEPHPREKKKKKKILGR